MCSIFPVSQIVTLIDLIIFYFIRLPKYYEFFLLCQLQLLSSKLQDGSQVILGPNFLLQVTHHLQYPPGTTYVYSYFESRGGKFPETCFFGLQYLLKRWFVGQVVTEAMVKEAKDFYKTHFSGLDVFNEDGWMYIAKVCKYINGIHWILVLTVNIALGHVFRYA